MAQKPRVQISVAPSTLKKIEEARAKVGRSRSSFFAFYASQKAREILDDDYVK